MEAIAGIFGMFLLFGFFAAVPMLPVSLYRIIIALRRHEPTRGHAGWLAFSIITLAVCGVVVYPVFMSARISAQDITCRNNMKALGMGMLQYEQDNDEKFPPQQHWGDAVAPYVKPNDYSSKLPADIWKCPAATSPFGYALNSNLPRGEADLNAPADIVMLFEADAKTRNFVGGSRQLPPRPRHPSLDNFTFADGHAMSKRRADVHWDDKPMSP